MADQHNYEIIGEDEEKGVKLKCKDCKVVVYENEEYGYRKYCQKER